MILIVNNSVPGSEPLLLQVQEGKLPSRNQTLPNLKLEGDWCTQTRRHPSYTLFSKLCILQQSRPANNRSQNSALHTPTGGAKHFW